MEILQTSIFQEWLRKLRNRQARTIIVQRIVRLQDGLLGDAHSIGDGVSELRIHFGPGYRVYYTIRGSQLMLLLCGGNKSTQEADIEKAKKLAQEIQL